MTVRLVGLGSELRGDDAAGLLVARRVRALAGAGASVEEVSGDLDQLTRALLADGEVIVVDAVRSPGIEGEILTLEAEEIGLGETHSSHGLGLLHAMEIAQVLGGRASLHLCGIRGRDFAGGAPVSPRVARACERLAVAIARLLEAPSMHERAGAPICAQTAVTTGV